MAECEPGLSWEQLVDILKSAVEVAGGNPRHLSTEYELSIIEQDCDYLVSAVSHSSTNHFALLIERSGKIKSWPWCCEPAYFVIPPEKPNE